MLPSLIRGQAAILSRPGASTLAALGGLQSSLPSLLRLQQVERRQRHALHLVNLQAPIGYRLCRVERTNQHMYADLTPREPVVLTVSILASLASEWQLQRCLLMLWLAPCASGPSIVCLKF